MPIPGFAGASSDALTHPRLQVFVESFLAAMASGEVERIMPFYGDRVDYYAKGPVGQDYIRQDKLAYFRRWPIVRQSLLGEIAVRDIAAPNEKAVTFRSAYEVYSPERKAHARGTSQSALVVAAVDGMLKIVDHKETVKSAGQ